MNIFHEIITIPIITNKIDRILNTFIVSNETYHKITFELLSETVFKKEYNDNNLKIVKMTKIYTTFPYRIDKYEITDKLTNETFLFSNKLLGGLVNYKFIFGNWIINLLKIKE